MGGRLFLAPVTSFCVKPCVSTAADTDMKVRCEETDETASHDPVCHSTRNLQHNGRMGGRGEVTDTHTHDEVQTMSVKLLVVVLVVKV